ncbi:MAG TPA: hypothetical protein VIL69_01925 [Roseomonas sp.]|jgi:hypothetical protein
MANDPDDLGDARSRTENGRFREMAERQKSANPEYAYAPRWVPTGNWSISWFDLFLWIFGSMIIVVPVTMGLLGYFERR